MKLIVHVGHGKTGSSSIQQSLKVVRDRLGQQGVHYLGLMLEYAQTEQRKPWQSESGSGLFFDQMDAEQASAELLAVLESEVEQLRTAGIKRAIWSNEWLLERSQRVLPVLKALEERGLEIEIQCYVRRHDKWIQSAYAQWGLKHKSYTGQVRAFENWLPVFGSRDFRFAPAISLWDTFGDNLRLFNFDAVDDVVQHFLSVNKITEIESKTENVSPDPVTMCAQAVFNSMKQDEVLPSAYATIERLLRRHEQIISYTPPLNELFPSADALASLVRERADDIAKVNVLLAKSGEPLLSFESPPKLATHPSSWEVDRHLYKLVFALNEEINQMRHQISMLQEASSASSGLRRLFIRLRALAGGRSRDMLEK